MFVFIDEKSFFDDEKTYDFSNSCKFLSQLLINMSSYPQIRKWNCMSVERSEEYIVSIKNIKT